MNWDGMGVFARDKRSAIRCNADEPQNREIVCNRSLFYGLLFILFFAIAVLIHLPGFDAPMLYDSDAFIQKSSHIYESRDLFEVIGIVPARPAFMMSLYANYLLTGFSPLWFRLFNAVVLAAAGMLVSLVSETVMGIPGVGPETDATERRAVGAFLGLVFVVHPLQSLVVLYIWQREAIMACMFYLAALAAYLAARLQLCRSTEWYACTGVFFLCGMLTKENVITLPLILVLAEVTLLQSRGPQLLRRAAIVACLAIPVCIAYVLIIHSLHGPHSAHPEGILNRLLSHYQGVGLSWVQVALTEGRVFLSYLGTIVFPFGWKVHLIEPMTYSLSLFDPPITALAFLGATGLMAIAVALGRRKPLWSFGILFFFIALVPESFLVPQYLYFGYRAILPMVGLLLIGCNTVTVVRWVQSRVSRRSVWVAGVIVFMVPCSCLAAITWSQAQRWSPMEFWRDAFYRLPPFSPRVEHIPVLDVLSGFAAQMSDPTVYRAHRTTYENVLRVSIRPDASPLSTPLLPPRNAYELNRNKRVARVAFTLGLTAISQGRRQEGIRLLEYALLHDSQNAAIRSALSESRRP